MRDTATLVANGPLRICSDASPHGYVCTLPRNHDGEHIAVTSIGRELATWPLGPARNEP